jgi:hypothetical protein
MSPPLLRMSHPRQMPLLDAKATKEHLRLSSLPRPTRGSDVTGWMRATPFFLLATLADQQEWRSTTLERQKVASNHCFIQGDVVSPSTAGSSHRSNNMGRRSPRASKIWAPRSVARLQLLGKERQPEMESGVAR